MKHILVSVFLIFAFSALTQELTEYEDLVNLLIWDDKVPNATVNEIIRKGFESDNYEIANLTLRAMGEASKYSAYGLLSPLDDVVPNRSFNTVNGLRNFLIDLWYVKFLESEYNIEKAILEATSLQEGENVEDRTRRILKMEENSEVTPKDIMAALNLSIPAWTNIPFILSVHWPKDQDVYELIWHHYTHSKSSGREMLTLVFLNMGKFESDRDNNFRLNILEVRDRQQSLDWHMLTMAAEGLRYSQPETSIMHLLRIGTNLPSSREKIIMTLTVFDESTIDKYRDEISSLISSLELDKTTPHVKAAHAQIDRIISRNEH